MTLTKHRVYLGGALETRTFLCRTQVYVREFGQHRPRLLWQQLMLHTGTAYLPAFARGSVDIIGAYLSLTFERSDIDPATRELVAEVERLRQMPCGGAGNQSPRMHRTARSPHHAVSSKTE